jgi:hypothetical protein
MTTILYLKENGTWVNPDGVTFYKYKVELADLTAGGFMAKSKDAWKVGDEVDYTVVKDDPQYGKSLKLTKPGQAVGGFAKSKFDPKNDHERQMLIVAQSSTDRAVQLVIAGKIELKDLEKVADRTMNIVLDLAKKHPYNG